MIPVRLKLRNFLSYAEPDPIDFTGFDVACLTGGNGRGKSTLLDAMTWAMFGAARGCEGGQNQDRLIRDGAEETEVDFSFELGEATYRIVRTRSRSGRADLRFLVGGEGSWTNLAGDSLRETEASIASVLRMDYRTFTASAFFLQGRADDFLARMRPEERKDVFARLLDLGTYERLEEAARSRAREAEVQRKERAARAAELAGAPDERARAEEELRSAIEEVDRTTGALAETEREVEECRRKLADVERTQAIAERERASLRELEERADRDGRALAAKIADLEELDRLLEREPEIAAALKEAEGLRTEERELRELASRRADLERLRTEANGRVEAEARTIRSQLEAKLEQAAGVAQEIRALEAQQNKLTELEEHLTSLGDVDRALEGVRAQLAELRERDASLSQGIALLEVRATETEEKIDLLDREAGECPLCGGELDAAHRRRILAETRREVQEIARDLERTRADRDLLRKEGRRIAEEEKRFERTAAEVQRLDAERTAVAARLERLPGLREEDETLRRVARGLEERLKTGDYAQEAALEVRRLDAEIGTIPLDPGAHRRIQERLEALEPYARLSGRVEEARTRRAVVMRELDDLRGGLTKVEQTLVERREALAELERALEGAEELQRQESQLRTELTRCRTLLDGATATHTRLTERLQAARSREEELERARAEERGSADRHRRYSRLVQAFGRGGVPDRIIENALPELTAEANLILGHLTDYEMTVQFAMDRLTKSGKVRETFDVLVHHDGGVRDFQMFSGGEAFRIAFAIRLGLSKLLVRRAGARLETLVIDEGFGSQDPEGRERLIEAINLARPEFRKILVISHLEELKDVFEAQLRVSKGQGEGSSVDLVTA